MQNEEFIIILIPMLLLFIKEAFLLSYLRLLLLFEVLIVTFLKKGFFHFAELVMEVLTSFLSSF